MIYRAVAIAQIAKPKRAFGGIRQNPAAFDG